MKNFLAIVAIWLFAWALVPTHSCTAQTPYTLTLQNTPVSHKTFVTPESDTSCTLVVKDAQDALVEDITLDNIAVAKDGKKGVVQQIIPLSSTKDADFRIVLVIDNSASMLSRLDNVLADMDVMMKQLSNTIDISVVSFSEEPMVLNKQKLYVKASPFMRNLGKVKEIYTHAMRKEYTSRTFLYDAVYAASLLLRQQKADSAKTLRTFVILLSDGRDIGSAVSSDTALAQVYTGGNAPVFFTIDYLTSTNKFLKALAQKTGGKYYAAERADDLKEILASVARDTYTAGYRVIFAWHTPPAITLSSVPRSITIEKSTLKESFPLLPYVFFDENSSALPERYKQISAMQASTFSPEQLEPDAMTYYYHLLNIIGARLTAIPQANITVTGCNSHSGEEKQNLDLSQARADVVVRYFTDVWGIAPQRIRVQKRNLPDAPSRGADNAEEASRENQRVEISSDTWEITKPVVFSSTVYAGYRADSTTVVSATVDSKEKINNCQWTLQSDNKTVLALAATSTSLPKLTITWSEVFGKQAPGSSVTVMLQAVNAHQDTAVQSASITAVVKTSAELSATQYSRDRVSLMLFPFGKADVAGNNLRIMKEFVYPRIQSTSNVVIKGYTDDIGTEEANLNIAKKRADAVGKTLAAAVKLQALQTQGVGESSPLFSNSLPEGRFYNRTVVVHIDTPVE